MTKKYLVTAALPYANGPLHLGHLAGAYLPADIFVRYQRAIGNDVAFICGTDEHGVPITIQAEKMGISPQELVDKNYELIKKSFEQLNIDFSIFSRTSSAIHHQTASEIFKKIYDQGLLNEQESEQFYDEHSNQFLADRYITGTCPKCNYERAYGDQCENCGSTLSPDELINPKSSLSGETPIKKKTTHWYLPLQDYQKQLEDYIINKHKDWKTNVYGQCKSWLNQGLQARAMTRDLNWGVKVPIENTDGKVLYVWFDAPIGYISMTKEWSINQGQADLWESYWKNEDCELIHFIGKDNIVFHAIIFPVILTAANDGYHPANNVPANEFLNLEGDKLSTSRNYAVWVHEFLEKFDADSLRFYLTTILPETKDSDFSWKQFQSTYNSDLADTIGNFINRTLTFINKYYDGKVTQRHTLNDLDKTTLEKIATISTEVGSAINTYEFRKALSLVMDFARYANKYFNDKEPWKSRKENPSDCETTLNICSQIVKKLGQLLYPFIPDSSTRILDAVKFLETIDWTDESELKTGHHIAETAILFKKIEDEQIEPEIERLQKIKESRQMRSFQAVKEEINIDTFNQIDLRTGKIIAAEAVPKAKKLLKLQV
ncbi:MAG: methionine--tRNA ligase, partial [Calditrichaeota bacterium]|nr:methionine--tRNA ligase [Calditrichota bacterium]